MASEDSSKQPTKRMDCTLGLTTIRYLELLSRTGAHGTSVSDVMKGLIEAAIRQAITDGWIGKIPPGA
jgi:hypothetical protein